MVPSVACLWVLGQTSGRVDVPDGAKIEAAAAIFWPGNTEALREIQSRGEIIQFFLWGLGGRTLVVQCVDADTLWDAPETD